MLGTRRPTIAVRPGAERGAALVALAGLAIAGCVLQTMRHATLEHPPWYSGSVTASVTGPILHLPVAWQESPRLKATLDPPAGPDSPLGRLLQDMNAYLDTLGVTSPLRGGTMLRGVPDVYFGCPADLLEGCLQPEDSVGFADRLFELYAQPASGGWTRWASAALDSLGAGGVLVLTLEFTYYWPRQSNLRGDKIVELGTEHTVPLAWLTALNAPVTVLQVTGALRPQPL